ncbi:hypothetical protein [Streptomyces sp. NBC_00239]|uniref:hypothetical protein n=1 Tax=Streptomyces sp. NBC_00239 TaxID=2903640 RepID=UPI002E2B98E5|nr:hypothetical protein [Streptomyces sp. NBC_00239]
MSTSSTDRHFPLTLPLALPAGTGVFIVALKTSPLSDAGVLALAVFLVVLFAPGLLKAGAKTAATLAKPRKKKSAKDKK